MKEEFPRKVDKRFYFAKPKVWQLKE